MNASPPKDDPAAQRLDAPIEPAPDHAEEDLADLIDDAVPSRSDSMLPMVGLGGSAGAITALQQFFTAVPAHTGMAYVVVLHLSADHESRLAEILQRCTAMPVKQVSDSAEVEVDHVYVIAPGKTIAAANGFLHCTDLKPQRAHRLAVDLFFRTLADTHGSHACAIVLSGADGDGAVGIKRIKERGGLAIAQDPSEAEHDGMPRSAIATGMVDWVLPVREMPARLVRYRKLLGGLELPSEDGPEPARDGEKASADDSEATLRALLAYLHDRTGRDFSYYKRATILRRIARRMRVNGVETLDAYLAFVRTHPGETGALLHDLLISVTNFFRDRDSFDALASRIPDLFVGKTGGSEVRAWVAGCATGEEAYSIAMLLAEHARTLSDPPTLQVFATDLDQDGIRIAREAIYPPAIAADVSEERLRRFFTRDGRGFRVRGEIREMVLFAVHDLLKDAPFSRLDLFSTRNLLIYLNHDAQVRAFDIAHYALRPGGLLFLGTSETIDGSTSRFDVLDRKHRLYRSMPIERKRLPLVTGQTTLARALALQDRDGYAVPPGLGLRERFGVATTLPPTPADAGAESWRELHAKLIEKLAPPSVVVTRDYDIVHLSQQAWRFLHFSGGEPTMNLLSAVDPGLTLELRTALLQARETGMPFETVPVVHGSPQPTSLVVMRVAPADDMAEGYMLVTFDQRPLASGNGLALAAPASGEAARRLEQQVDELKWQMRMLVEHGNATTEDLKASNEELQARNEELRSATEELETSREELQSINEELTTVNHELKSSVEELARTNGDLENLISSTAIATIFLDRSLRITLFTPRTVELF
ncbi:MAG: chemotaxis protein CheB, partial [Caldimonas sp.]